MHLVGVSGKGNYRVVVANKPRSAFIGKDD